MDATPWPEVQDLLDYWVDYPPLHLMVRAYLGIGQEDEDHEEMTPEQMQAWVQQLQG